MQMFMLKSTINQNNFIFTKK